MIQMDHNNIITSNYLIIIVTVHLIMHFILCVSIMIIKQYKSTTITIVSIIIAAINDRTIDINTVVDIKLIDSHIAAQLVILIGLLTVVLALKSQIKHKSTPLITIPLIIMDTTIKNYNINTRSIAEIIVYYMVPNMYNIAIRLILIRMASVITIIAAIVTIKKQ